MDIPAALKAAFRDQEWKLKLLLGGLIMAVPVLNFAAIGYELHIIRRVASGDGDNLPRWDGMGRYFNEGLMLGLARLVYALPIFVLMGLAFLPLLPFVFARSEDAQRLAFAGVMLGCGLLFPLMMLYAYTLAFLLPAISVIYLQEGKFSSCFRLGLILGLARVHFKDYVRVWLAGLLAGLALSVGMSVLVVVFWIPFIGQIAMILLLYPAIFWMQTVTGHATGQFVRKNGLMLSSTAA